MIYCGFSVLQYHQGLQVFQVSEIRNRLRYGARKGSLSDGQRSQKFQVPDFILHT